MKRILTLMISLIMVFSLVACNSNDEGKDILNPYFTGKVVEIYDKSCLIEVTDIGNGHFAVGDKVVVSTDITNCPIYSVGDYLTISFDGKVAESYPPQILKVFMISKADGDVEVAKEDTSTKTDGHTETTNKDSNPDSTQGDTTPKTEGVAETSKSQDDENSKSNSSTKGEQNDNIDIEVIDATFTMQQYASIKYWLYTPENPKKDMPLIVYLHGGSGKGDDLELITAVDGFPQYVKDKKVCPDAYIIMPQVSSDYKGWGDIKANLMKLINFVKTEYKIDENKISLTGHSMGGTGTWQLALAYPNTFSAIAPLSGSVKFTDANISKLKNTPVWAIVGEVDKIVDPSSSISFIEELQKINPKAKITVITGADHFAVPTSYLSGEYNIVSWLIEQ